MRILDKIQFPSDLKELTIEQLKLLAEEIRQEVIRVVSKNGGHLAPTLGVVEITLALHYVFNSPHDKIVWDIGHQAYAHKLITGRRNEFHTLRQYKGISGYLRICESEHDAFGAGHGSTSLSAGLGIATARDLKGETFKVIVIIGDGAMSGGIAFEGLNNIGQSNRDILIILNDNKMSISKNVGALAQYLTKITTRPIYHRLERDVWELLGKLPKNLGYGARVLVKRIRGGIKDLIVSGMPFEELGFRYEGPVDGHNLEQLIDILIAIKDIKGPVLLHVLTVKGRGYPPAEEDAVKFHGVGPFEPDTGAPRSKPNIPSYTEIFGKTLVEMAEINDKIVAITAAMPEGTGLNFFIKKFQDRFFDVGMAEQHAVTFAAGLACQGLRPVAAIYSTFLQRSFDQIIHDVALQKLPVVFAIDRAGLVGEDGATHHGCFDIAYLSMIPNMVIMAPKDENEFRRMLLTAIQYTDGPIAIRYPRGSGLGVPLDSEILPLELGKGEIIHEGKDVFLIAIGTMVDVAEKAAMLLEKEDVKAGVVNARFVKPLDLQLLDEVISVSPKLVTIEEGVIHGGFGESVLATIQKKGVSSNKILCIGIPDQFIEHGDRNSLLKACGLDPNSIASSVLKFLTGK